MADATHLPLAAGSVDAVVYVWVLHHIGDIDAALREAKRVLRPRGRVVAVSGLSEPAGDDMAPIFERLSATLRPNMGRRAGAVVPAARLVGFTPIHEGTVRTSRGMSPNELANAIEQRLFSQLWDTSEEAWAAVVAPAVKALRALPRPDRRRRRVFDHPLVVLDRGP